MASDKRDFTNFTEFPGKISSRGWYEFPPLYHVDIHENKRIWKIQARLIKSSEEKPLDHDWNLLEQNEVPIVPDYLEGNPLPSGTISQLWVETGVVGGKISRHQPTYPPPVNVSKINERNELLQALVQGRSKWQKKYSSGSLPEDELRKTSTSSDDVQSTTSTRTSSIQPNTKRYFPMLLFKYEDKSEYINFPALGQPKLDGVRAVFFLNLPNSSNIQATLAGATYENVEIYSRQLKDIPGFTDHRKEMLPLLKKAYTYVSRTGEITTEPESLYVDGEFYTHGYNLQQISGIVRNEKRNEDKKRTTAFYIFDCFYPSCPQMPFVERFRLIKKLYGECKLSSSSFLKLTKTVILQDDAEVNKRYQEFLGKKYEGLIVKNTTGLYLSDPQRTGTHLRSKEVLKIKARYSSEYKVVDFKEGSKGRDKGAIIWVCVTENGRQFNVTPKDVTYEWRYCMFTKLSKGGGKVFKNKYEGRMITVEYEDLSKDGIPLRAKALSFRDIE